MKKILTVFKAVCPVCTAVTVYGAFYYGTKETAVAFAIAAVFSIALTVMCFILSSLFDRVSFLETVLGDDGWAQDERDLAKKECPVCHALLDEDHKVCPYCENRNFDEEYFHTGADNVRFATDDPDYNGTDFSGEDLVSANFDTSDDSMPENEVEK